jgi:hypothetical protein
MARLSLEEIIATTKHANLPTVFVEGPSDMAIFNRIEQEIGTLRANFLSCGDRETLFNVFRRRSEFTNIPTCFLADKDMWFFSDISPEYSEIIFTEGYSIENDLYVDSKIERILDVEERMQHAALIEEVCRWFAFEVNKYTKGIEFRSDPNLSRLIPVPGLKCCPNYLSELGFCDPPAELVQSVAKKYALGLRGKLLFEIIVRFTHAPKRKPRRYSYESLIELSVVYGLHEALITRIVNAIKEKLQIPLVESQPALRV